MASTAITGRPHGIDGLVPATATRPTAPIATVSRCSTSSTSPSASPAAATVSTPPRMAPAVAASTIARDPASVQPPGWGPGPRGPRPRAGGRPWRDGGPRRPSRGTRPRRRPPCRWGRTEVAAGRVHDAEPGQHREVGTHGPAPAAPHPEGHDDRRQQRDADRAGQLLELGRLRHGDEIRVEVLGQHRPRPDREQDDSDRQDDDEREDDAQALGAAGRRRHGPTGRGRLDQRRVGGGELLGRAVGDVRPLVDGRLVSGRRGRRSPRAPCDASRSPCRRCARGRRRSGRASS